ncbi:hypothetical protein H5410_040798 [Solanum commersonii]|uniref:Uncharacterized protein n=1 Tax=Solanum commersonii TaxID=4109 RepID=A0A9J5XSK3_SOLCO|nr:hypothetical protein H5410_040798 [Solanum commersonii]
MRGDPLDVTKIRIHTVIVTTPDFKEDKFSLKQLTPFQIRSSKTLICRMKTSLRIQETQLQILGDETLFFFKSSKTLTNLYGSFDIVSLNRRSTQRFALWCSSSPTLKQKAKYDPLATRQVDSAILRPSFLLLYKTQFTYAKIKCALKDSSCDSPISTNLMLTILGSNASSSSTIVFRRPHTKNEYIFTQWFHSLKLWNQMQRSHSQRRK